MLIIESFKNLIHDLINRYFDFHFRQRKSSSSDAKSDSSQEAQMLTRKPKYLEVQSKGINRLQSVSSSDSGYQDPTVV